MCIAANIEIINNGMEKIKDYPFVLNHSIYAFPIDLSSI